ncbi:putative reverse transcriptase domain-containing protein [Tanacetum coccineum]
MQEPSESGTRVRVPSTINPKVGKGKRWLNLRNQRRRKINRNMMLIVAKRFHSRVSMNSQALKVKREVEASKKEHFARLRAEEQRRKLLTKDQKRNQMSNYLKNMAGYTLQQLRDTDDELWKLQKHIHDLTWRLYDSCGVHHVSTEKGIDIYMLVEKEYPLSRGTLTLMLVAKLLVDQYNEMSRELLRKIFMQDQQELLMKCPQHYLTEMHEIVLFYNGLDVPTRQILDSRGAIPSKTTADAKVSIQEWPNSLKNGTTGHLELEGWTYSLDNHYCEEEGNYGPKFTEACGASHINNAIPRKEKDPGSFTLPCFINDFYFDNALVDLGASVSVMPLSTYLNLGLGELVHTRLTVELADRTVKYPKGIAENVLVGIGKFTFPVDFIILDMPEDIRVPLILERPFLSTAHAKIDVYKRKFTLRVGEENIIFKSVKPASSIIKRVYMLSLRERMELDLEARLMGETLVINRSLDPFLEDYIELNDLNEPFELRRNQGNDLMPTIEEGEVIKEFRTRNEDLDTGIDDYPSYCDDDKKIHIDCAHNLKFSCMIGFEFTHANFFPLLYVNMMSRKFHNSIMKNKMVYKGNNVVGSLMNVPIFIGTFSIMTDFAVLENMDAYRDEGIGDVIFGEPFLREVDIKSKRFEGMITLYKGDDEVTYQMVRSHPRFKHHTNEQCNKIPPLLKVNEKDVMNGVSHAYQKLKGFYK